MKNYYQMTPEETLLDVCGSLEPLSKEQIAANKEKYGPNELVEGKRKEIWQIFLEQFKDFLVIILIIAAIVSGFLGDVESTVVILVVITMNAVLGTVQTIKAQQSLDSLKKLSGPTAKILRDGELVELPSTEITVGDIVSLDAGDYIPADGRLLESASLKVDESALTGESLGIEKQTGALEGQLSLGDRTNMVYSGSFVTYGRGTFVVTATGMETEVGKIAGLLKNAADKRTPLQVSLDQFGARLSVLILVFCGILFALSIFRGDKASDAFLFAVALAVAAIPEALSSIVTIVLSFGTQKMAKEHAIVRKLQAVEGLGSVSVICSDKTGTLTQNKMTVEYYYADEMCISAGAIPTDESSFGRLLLSSILCNDATTVDGAEIGDPTETCLVNLAVSLGISPKEVREKYPRLGENPFDSDRKLMSTGHIMENVPTLLVKGAVDELLPRITAIQIKDEIRPIRTDDVERIERQNKRFSQEGLRVLGFAYRIVKDASAVTLEDESGLIFTGLIAMMDPPREESAKAVSECISAGIRPIMITGDHKVTASAIARRIGIMTDKTLAVEGSEIDTMSDEELRDFVPQVSVYARVSPEHKIRIVRAWQKRGNIVAMTGDGVNDAPALKQADIGVAMGITGSEVSKDAASMVLTDDNFATIVKAVENGRNLYRNIKHSILFLLSGNFAAIIAVLFASVMNLPVPFAPVHLLFINLLTDSLPAIALGLEPHTSDVMKDRPRPIGESILTRDFLIKIGIEGLSISIMTMIGYYIGYGASHNKLLASTMAFSVLCLSRLFHGFNCKSEKAVVFTRAFFNNVYLIGAFAAGAILLTAVISIPALHSLFKVQTLGGGRLLIVYVLAFLNVPVIQFIKRMRTVNARRSELKIR